jgi:hypothetical protein
MDTEKQAELVRLYIQLQVAADALNTQATEVYERARKLEDLTKDTTLAHRHRPFVRRRPASGS